MQRITKETKYNEIQVSEIFLTMYDTVICAFLIIVLTTRSSIGNNYFNFIVVIHENARCLQQL